jgi:putative oxidoreductase
MALASSTTTTMTIQGRSESLLDECDRRPRVRPCHSDPCPQVQLPTAERERECAAEALPVSPMTGVAPTSLSGINGMTELVGGVLIVLGLFTRPVAFILAGDMAVAYFIAHSPRGFFPLLNAGELAIIYCFVILYLAVAGGGEWSVDHLRAASKAPQPA